MASDYLQIFGEMIVVNAAFSFSSDVVAQLLEGKRFCLEKKPEDESQPLKEGEEKQVEKTPEQLENREQPVQVFTPFDWTRAIKFASTGVIFCGAVQFVRLEVIDHLFPADGSLWVAIEKTVFNQLVFSPVVRAMSMATIQYIKTYSCADVWTKLKNDFCEAQAVSYAVKPVSNVLAFMIFPHNLIGQTITMRTVAFAYNVYFSYKANKELGTAGKPDNGCDAPTGDPNCEGPQKPKKEGEEEGEHKKEGEEGEKKKGRESGCCLCRCCS